MLLLVREFLQPKVRNWKVIIDKATKNTMGKDDGCVFSMFTYILGVAPSQ